MSNIVITGGAGFIGSHLCDYFLKAGHDVICADNLITGDKKNIQHLLKSPHFTFIEQDVTKESARLEAGSEKLEYIFHLASPASPNRESPKSFINHPIETLLANSLGTYHMLELAEKINARFLFASSSEVYGDPTVHPQKEDYFGNVNPVGVRSVYDEGKRFGEAMVMAFVRKKRVDGRIVRIFNTYGERMQDDGRVVSNFIRQALAGDPLTVYGDGEQTRSFCYISDMVSGIARAMLAKGTRGEVINLGNPHEQTILEIALLIKKLTGSKSKIVYKELPQDDPHRRKPDITKAKRLLSWEPKVGIEEGLEKTIQYFKTAV